MSLADRLGAIGTSATRLRTWPRRYSLAVFVVAFATLVRYAMELHLGPFPPFLLFVPAIIVVAVLAGLGPGILATSLSTLSVAYFYLISFGVPGSARLAELIALLLFCAIGIITSGLANLYRRHDARLREFERVVENLEEMIVVLDRDYRYRK